MNDHQKEEVSPVVSEPIETNAGMSKMITVRNGVIVAAVLIIAALVYYEKGLVVAATVNGSPISRFAVIAQLEKTSGKATLDSLINKKLIDEEASKKGVAVTDADVQAELGSIEKQVTAQGGKLVDALAQQGMTMDDLKGQIITQKKLERLLVDKIQVTDADVVHYIKDNKVTIPKGQEAAYKTQIMNQLKQQKMQSAADALVVTLHSQAKITYFVNY